MSLMDWVNVCLHFMMLSMLAVGGAIATIPEMHRYLVTQQGWLSESAFNSSITLAQAAPGPNVLFVALMGWNFGLGVGGPWALGWAVMGACVCLTSVLLPSSITTFLITRWAHRNRDLRAVRAFKAGMEPTIPALHCSITSVGLLMMNSGEPMTGSARPCSACGRRDIRQRLRTPRATAR